MKARLALALGLALQACLSQPGSAQFRYDVLGSSPAPTRHNEASVPASACEMMGGRLWTSLASAQHPFRVWATCTGSYQADLQATLALIDGQWGPIRTYLGRQPLPDVGDADAGGDAAIDIYLVNIPDPVVDSSAAAFYELEMDRVAGNACALVAQFETAPRGSSCVALAGDAVATAFSVPDNSPAHPGKASGILLMRRNQVGSPDLLFTMTHELFHVFQFSFSRDVAVPPSGAHWFVEASAVWAEWYFHRDNPRRPPTGHLGLFTRFQGDERALNDTLQGHTYAAYVWPVFMTEDGGGGRVAAAWKAMEGQPDFNGLDDAIDQQLPFAENFRKFALRNRLDDFPGVKRDVTRHTNPDPHFPEIKPALVDLKTAFTNPVKIPNLRAAYRRLAVKPDTRKLELDFSGLSPAGDLDVDALVKIQGKWELRQIAGGKLRFCRTVAKERVDEIELVLSNHQKRAGEIIGGISVEALLDECKGWGGTITYEERGNLTTDPAVSFLTGTARHSLLASVSVEDGEGTATVQLRKETQGTENFENKCVLQSSSQTNASGGGSVVVDISVDADSVSGEYRISIGSVPFSGSWHEGANFACVIPIPAENRSGAYDDSWSYEIRGVLDPAQPGLLSGSLKEGLGTVENPEVKVTWSLFRY